MNARLRIALYTYATQARGGVAHAIELGGALHDLGHDVLLHALDDGAGFFRTPRCPTRAIPVPPYAGPTTAFVCARIAAYVAALAGHRFDRSFDIHHAHDGISANALATLVACGHIPRFVRTVHHADDFADPELAALQTRSIAAAGACLVVSDEWRHQVRERFGIAATRVSNGVDTARFVPLAAGARARVRARFGLTGDPLFLVVGGVEARKNSIRILEAFARVRTTFRDARLAIAGGASVLDHATYRRAFAARATELAIERAVTHLGVVDDRAMPDLIAAADALVFPSLVEGFGLVNLEALACEVAVVTSAIAPFTEYLTANEAELVDPTASDAIAAGMRAALEPATRARRRLAGAALAARFPWSASARTHVACYEEVVRAGDPFRGALAR
ncbi:MAG: MSMEG_0565 family glycosyltransferase [Vulcanimicrobiaceae bacterium]